MDANENTPNQKPCMICGRDLTGQPRLKDKHGQYVCQAYADTRQACTTAVEAGPPAPDAVDVVPIGLAPAPAPAEVPKRPMAISSCPLCLKRFADDVRLCTGCGFDASIGIKSSSLAPKTKTPAGRTVLCTNCRYDMGAGVTMTCPECGTRVPPESADTRRKRASDDVTRAAYRTPALMLVIGASIMLGYWWLNAGVAGVIFYGVTLPAATAFGVLIFQALCLMWIGFDAPLHLTFLRLAGIYAVYDVIRLITGFIPIPIFPWLLGIAIYIGMLTKLLDIDLYDAIYLSIGTFLAKVVIFIAVAMLLAGSFL